MLNIKSPFIITETRMFRLESSMLSNPEICLITLPGVSREPDLSLFCKARLKSAVKATSSASESAMAYFRSIPTWEVTAWLVSIVLRP